MRKLYSLTLFYCLMTTGLLAQGVAINTDGTTADPSAMLHVKSSTSGFLLPTMTTAQRTAIVHPATGLLVYQTDGMTGFYYNAGTPAGPNWFFIQNSGTDNIMKVNISGSTNVNATITDLSTRYVLIDYNNLDNNPLVTITLPNPAAVGPGVNIRIASIRYPLSGSLSGDIFATTSSGLIYPMNGAANTQYDSQFTPFSVVSDGTNWYQVF